MTSRDVSATAVQLCALAVLILGTAFAFTVHGYPPLFILLLIIGWLAGVVGLVEERRGASARAIAAFFIVAVVVPNFFAEYLNLLLVVAIIAHIVTSRRYHAVER